MGPRPTRTTVGSDGDEENTPLEEDNLHPRKRKRNPSGKQMLLDQANAAKEMSTNEKLRLKMKKMQQQMDALIKAANMQNQDMEEAEDSDPDRLPVESEDDDNETSMEMALRPSLRKKDTTVLKVTPTPTIRRRQGSAALSASHTPSPAPSALPESAQQSPLTLAPWVVQPITTSETTHPPQPPALRNDNAQFISPPSAQSSPPPQSHADTPSVPELKPAPFRNGVTAPRNRPNAGDYIDEVRDLLLQAIAHYYVSLFTINAFPNTAQQREFVLEAWKHTCAAQENRVPWALSERMINVIGRRKSNARGDISDAIRPLIVDAYKFRTAVNKSNEQYNALRSVRLIDDGIFHHKKFDLDAGTKSHFAENKFISTAIGIAFFSNPKSSVGFQYPSRFNPMPQPTIAFILTVIHAHIREWSTGQRVQEHFKETANSSFYAGFKEDLVNYGKGNETAWLNIRRRLFERAFRAAGGSSSHLAVAQVSTTTMAAATAELAQRTGLTDSEDEGGEGDE